MFFHLSYPVNTLRQDLHIRLIQRSDRRYLITLLPVDVRRMILSLIDQVNEHQPVPSLSKHFSPQKVPRSPPALKMDHGSAPVL